MRDWSPVIPVFHPQSPQTAAIAGLFSGVLVTVAAIFLLVTILVVFAIFRYRERSSSGSANATPKQIFGSHKLEVLWTAVPLVIVLALFAAGVRTMASVDAPQNGSRQNDLVIVGHQWWWEARYPNGATAANEIHIPVGRKLLVRVESTDVIHDLWVPELARKIDAVPGTPGYIWLEAAHPGTYLGVCSEFCGTQHAGHRLRVIAEPEEQFAAWLNAQTTDGAPPPPSWQSNRCADCHTVHGIETGPMAGPTLAHIAGRTTLGGGPLANDPDSLLRWIRTPQAVKPGVLMPDRAISDADAKEIVEYLSSLR